MVILKASFNISHPIINAVINLKFFYLIFSSEIFQIRRKKFVKLHKVFSPQNTEAFQCIQPFNDILFYTHCMHLSKYIHVRLPGNTHACAYLLTHTCTHIDIAVQLRNSFHNSASLSSVPLCYTNSLHNAVALGSVPLC